MWFDQWIDFSEDSGGRFAMIHEITPNWLRLPTGFPLYCTSKLWDIHYLYRSVLLKGCLGSCCNWSSSTVSFIVTRLNEQKLTLIKKNMNLRQNRWQTATFWVGSGQTHNNMSKVRCIGNTCLKIINIKEEGGRMPPCMWRSSLYTGRWQNFGHLMQTQSAFHHPT